MPSDLLDTLLDGPFALTPRPEPVPGDLRLSWGVAIVVLLLGKSRGKKASFQKLHFLAHSVHTEETQTIARHVLFGERRAADLLVRVEPWLNRAIAFAKGAGLIDIESGKSAKLTARGLEMLNAVNADESVLVKEKHFLDSVSQRTTESAIQNIMRMEPA